MAAVENCKQLLFMEVKVLSARSLKGPSSLFSGRLRPYVTLSAAATTSLRELDEPPHRHTLASHDALRRGGVYRTRVDQHGGENPAWGDTIHLPLDPSFLRQGAAAAVHLLVLSKRRLAGPTRLGWCCIPASDVVDGLRPPSAVRRLSYALRNCRHGGRGHGVVDLAVRLVGPAVSSAPPPARPAAVVPEQNPAPVPVLGVLPASGWAGQVAIGIPVQSLGFAETSPETRKERGGWGGGQGGAAAWTRGGPIKYANVLRGLK